MTELATTLIIFESILIANLIMLVALFKLWKSKQQEAQISDELSLTEKAKILYQSSKENSRKTLSLSLGQEELSNSSCPSLYHYVRDERQNDWTITY